MKNFVKSFMVMAFVLCVSGGAVFADLADFTYAGHIGMTTHNGGYVGITDVGTGSGGLLNGVWKRTDGVVFDERVIAKFDISAATANVDTAVIAIHVLWSSLNTGNLIGDVMIESFATASDGAIVATDSGWDASNNPIAPISSKVAWSSTASGVLTVDVADMLNAAIDAGQDSFCIRLTTDYLLVDPARSEIALGANPVQYVYGGSAISLTKTDVPEPATMSLLALGGLAGLIRRRG